MLILYSLPPDLHTNAQLPRSDLAVTRKHPPMPSTAKRARKTRRGRSPENLRAPSQPPEPRRRPQQDRSRERVEAILGAARELIGSRSNDAVSMREIAARAGVPISSVYQYFPDKTAILRELMLGYLGQITAELARVLDSVRRLEELPAAIDAMVDVMVDVYQREREFPTIWAAVQANTVLRQLDADDGKRIAEFLAARLCDLAPDVDPDDIRSISLYAVHTISSTVRVALLHSDPKDGERIIREFKMLLKLRFEDLTGVKATAKKTKRRPPSRAR